MLTPSPFLLADPSACLRRLVLLDLMGKGLADREVQELEETMADDGLVRGLIQRQNSDGSWDSADLGSAWGRGNRILATSAALYRLGYAGFGASFGAVQKGADYLYGCQQPDGGWPLSLDRSEEEGKGGTGYTLVPLQTALPLRGLAVCGYASDARSERAYDWLLEQRLEDGAWPTGIAAGVHGFVGGYRRLAHSQWGCRSNTTAALGCLSLHPQRKDSSAARRAFDLLLGRESQEENSLGFEVARTVGAEALRGFFTFFAHFDLGQVLDFAWRLGASGEDPRLKAMIQFVTNLRGPRGLWTYPNHPQAARWVSFDLTRSLLRLSGDGWEGSEPRTPFRAYPRQIRRF